MRTALLALAPALLLLVCAAPADARPGQLDKRYGKRGVATTKLLDGGMAGTVDPRNRLVVAGDPFHPGVVRFTARGGVDRTFGNRGATRFTRARTAAVLDVQRRPGGRLVVGLGSRDYGTPSLALLRFTAGGRRPVWLPDLTPFDGPLLGGGLRPDGGAVAWTEDGRIHAIRPDGSVDGAFAAGTASACGAAGLRTCDLTAATVMRDGSVVAAVGRGRTVLLVRLNRQGFADARWGRNGTVAVPFAASVLRAARDGSLVLAAEGRRGGLAQVAKVTARGTAVRRFGRRGVANLRPRAETAGVPRDVVIDARGRIYVLAELTGDAHVARLSPRGRQMRRFGRGYVAWPPRVPRGADAFHAERLVLDRRRGLLVVAQLFTGGEEDPSLGCGIREDLCAAEVATAVWRLRR